LIGNRPNKSYAMPQKMECLATLLKEFFLRHTQVLILKNKSMWVAKASLQRSITSSISAKIIGWCRNAGLHKDLFPDLTIPPGLVPGPAGGESGQVANAWQAPEFASLLRGKVMGWVGCVSVAYPPQAPAGYDHRDFALFDIVGRTPIFRPHRPAAPGRASVRPGRRSGHHSQ